MNAPSITVLISTYNRDRLLAETLETLARIGAARGDAVEILVVDNNSTDETRSTVQRIAAGSACPVVYAFETRQGKSFALNRGLALARGEIVALTDDDVIPAEDWLDRIASAFEDPRVDFAFGKVLPRWGAEPPAELLLPKACAIWGPLALLDYGDECTYYTPERFGYQRLPVGANLAFRTTTLRRIGGWRTDLGKVDNTLISGEDHEIFVRLHRSAPFLGVYDPGLVVRHHVPPDRLTRRYFRRWFFWHGRTMARMAESAYHRLNLSRVPHVLRVPRFLYRQFAEQFGRWLWTATTRRDPLARRVEELMLIEYVGYFAESWARRRS
jgi:glycosyltransferase involved in cell wall biosynthesis